MCLIVFAYRIHPRYRLILAANRDEFYTRPAAPADWWESPAILAGRDLLQGGSWLGLDRRGRLAAVTNVRNPADILPGRRSRGELVPAFLAGTASAGDFAAGLDGTVYPGFNLLLDDGQELVWSSNRAVAPRRLPPGLYALSNAALDTPWPKVLRAKQLLAARLADATLAPEALLQLLADDRQPDDDQLPDTGVGRARERALAPIRIRTPDYGSRTATVVLAGRDGTVEFVERTLATPASPEGQRTFRLAVAGN